MEPITRFQIAFDYVAYCRVVLAIQLLQNELREWPFRLEEFGETAMCRAIIHREMAADFSSWVSEHDTYNYDGYGPGASGFGFDSEDTVAWLIPHKTAPAIFWKQKDEIGSGRVMTWLNSMADDIELGNVTEIPAFPVIPKEGKGDPIVPPEVIPDFKNRRGFVRRVGRY